MKLCDAAQKWANYLAALNEFYYRPAKTLGQNLFCCPCSALVTDLTGKMIDIDGSSVFTVISAFIKRDKRNNRFRCVFLFHLNRARGGILLV